MHLWGLTQYAETDRCRHNIVFVSITWGRQTTGNPHCMCVFKAVRRNASVITIPEKPACRAPDERVGSTGRAYRFAAL